MAGSAVEPNMSRPTSGIVSPRHIRSRAQSISSDRPSTVGHHNLMTPPQPVSPDAGFIAATAASQIVTNDHESHADTWYDQNGVEPAPEAAVVTGAALQLVNSFLDQLLFSFLQVSRATTLAALRPAVSEVLKPKLAKDTIRNADEELREYLGGGDEDDYVQPQGPNSARDWDLELVWKRTRLRCMVYSSLGDLEEEDEDLYMEQENLEIGSDEQISDVISPAVAIFLTSVLEYMGELTLTVAGQAASNRMRTKIEKDLKDGTREPGDIADRLVVEELDMERVVLDRTLGRLWRGWKKRIRAPATPIDVVNRAFARGSGSQARESQSSVDALSPRTAVASDTGSEFRKSQEHIENTIIEDVEPVDIPLPMGDRDVDEIEVPGLVHYSDDEDELEDEEENSQSFRPKSLFIAPSAMPEDIMTPLISQPATPVVAPRKRSLSLPTPGASPFFLPSKLTKEAQLAEGEEKDIDEEQAASETDEKEDTETDTDSDAVSDAKATPETPTGRGLKVVTGAAALGATAVAAAAATAAAAGDSDSDYGPDDTEDATVYEKAEIMTSSRVSVGGTSSPSTSESGKPVSSLQRSSSVHSARLIDVTGPKSPTGSRPTSMEAVERVRPVSLSGLTNLSHATNAEELRKAKAMDSGTGATASRPTGDRMRPSIPNATTISESDEDEDEEPAPLPIAGARSQSSRVQAMRSSARQDTAPLKQDRVPAGIKLAPLKTSSTNSSHTSERSPDLPRRSPGHQGWQSVKGDGKRFPSMERSRTYDSDDDDLGLPLPQNIIPRQIHTSASSISSSASRLKPVRTSEDNSSSHAESVARNFEELIQSNQTITYTLTPENMRDNSKRSLDSPVVTKSNRKSEDARLHNQPRSSPTIPQPSPSPTTRRMPNLGNQSPIESKLSRPAGPVPRAPPGLAVTTGRMSGPQAREARVPTDSTADFAEFIKSTGPPNENKTPLGRNGNVSVSPAKMSSDSRRVSTTSNRSRYQPRDAAVDNRSDNADLLSFIRQGPPIAATNHRIPRHVAPFRTTMDSDQMNGAVGGKAVDATIPEIRYSQASTNHTDNSMPSMQSSVNSNSALLKNKGSNATSKMYNDEDMMPKRKTRRVRDPYAIDFSDEEDDEELMSGTPAPPVKKEESLAEFLRNYDPPAEPVSAPRKQPKKKASAPSLINRFRSGNRDAKETRGISSANGDRTMAPNVSRSLSSRIGTAGGAGGATSKGHVPIQVSMPPGYDKYGPTDSNTGRPRVVSSMSTMGRVPMKKFEPREPVAKRSETNDLAAFLRDSEPPESFSSRGSQLSPRNEEGNSFAKMFGRRKKSVV